MGNHSAHSYSNKCIDTYYYTLIYFFIWTDTKQELEAFTTELNKKHDSIKFDR